MIGKPTDLVQGDVAEQKLTDTQLRCKQAAEEIRNILDAYDAELFPVMAISPKGILGTTIDIVPKQNPNSGSSTPAPETLGGPPPTELCDCEDPISCETPCCDEADLVEALTEQDSPDMAA